MRTKTPFALAWMRCLFEHIGDYMPHKTEVHLPVSYTKTSLHARMKKEMIEIGIGEQSIISKEYFMEIFRRVQDS